MNLTNTEKAYLAAVGTDFNVFVRKAFNTLYPNKAYEPNWHIEAIITALESNVSGKTRRLIINLPPRHLKSFLISVAWPAYLLTRDPSLKIFCVSYSDELAKVIARDFRRLVEAAWYHALFPHVRLTKITENDIITDKGGYRCALSVNGSITGRGADLIIIDDPLRPEDALSEKLRTGVNEWYRSTLMSRLDDKLRSGLIVVMQRLHVNDLTGFIEAGGEVCKLSFPALATRDETIPLRNGNTHRRRRGDPLQPGRESESVLRRLRDQIGAFNFAAQYQQSPRTPDGTLFKRSYFKLIDELPRYRAEGKFFISIDTALSTSSSSDFTAVSVVYVDWKRLHVIHAERGRWDYELLKPRILALIEGLPRLHNKPGIIVEYAGVGITLAKFLERAGDDRYIVNYRTPKEDKVSRAARVLPWLELGIHILNVPGKNAWVAPFLNEFMNFPNGANDDQVDSLVQLMHMNAVLCLLPRPTWSTN